MTTEYATAATPENPIAAGIQSDNFQWAFEQMGSVNVHPLNDFVDASTHRELEQQLNETTAEIKPDHKLTTNFAWTARTSEPLRPTKPAGPTRQKAWYKPCRPPWEH